MFKNKAEREKFLREYREWLRDGYREWMSRKGMYYDYKLFDEHEIKLKFYRCQFKNGSTVIVTECETNGKLETRYNLIIPDNDSYNPWDQHSGRTQSEFRGYNLQGVSVGVIVDYMTKRKDEI